jgi:DNA-directed RNA polymerase III subunit RPC8
MNQAGLGPTLWWGEQEEGEGEEGDVEMEGGEE